MANKGTAYLLWFFSTFGMCGIHRLYLGKPVSGILYFMTFGFFGIGQVIDLFLIPDMVDHKNLKQQMLYGSAPSSVQPPIVQDQDRFSHAHPPLEVQILKVCRDLQGATLSDCVIASQRSADEVRTKVQELCLEELLVVDNRDGDGAVIYRAV